MSIWAAGITAAVTIGTTAYTANQNKKNAKIAAGGASGGFKPGAMPDFEPVDIGAVDQMSFRQDVGAYGRSDRDFARRHSGLLGAEKLFEAQTLKDQQGESELLPALQSEFMRAGLSKSLGAFGGNSLAPGSAGEANVARNFGLGIMDFQDRNRANRQQSLTIAEGLFPRRKFGLSGADAAQLSVANTAGENNWNQANYANQFQTGQSNYNNQLAMQNANAQADAERSAATQQAIIQAATLAAQLGTQRNASGGWNTSASGTRWRA